MTADEALRFVERHGVVLEAARGSVPSMASAVLGVRHRGSWWGHRKGKAFFQLTRHVRDSKDILVCRLVDGKVTYVHRRRWPALARLAPGIEATRLAAIREMQTASGAHRMQRTSFRRWVTSDVLAEAEALTESDALAQVSPWICVATKATLSDQGRS